MRKLLNTLETLKKRIFLGIHSKGGKNQMHNLYPFKIKLWDPDPFFFNYAVNIGYITDINCSTSWI